MPRGRVYGFKDKSVAQYLRNFAVRNMGLKSTRSAPALRTSIEELVRFYNNTEENCPGGAVLQPEYEVEDPTQHLVTVIKKPDGSLLHEGFLVNLQPPGSYVESGHFGWARRLEQANWVLARFPTDISDILPTQPWGPIKDDWRLKHGMLGFHSTGGWDYVQGDDSSLIIRAVQHLQPDKVQLWVNDGYTRGHLVDVNSAGLYPARMLRMNSSGALDIFSNCWIGFMDFFQDESLVTAPVGVHGRIYDGFPAGSFVSDPDADPLDWRPLYSASAGVQGFLAKTSSGDAVKGTPTNFTLYNKDMTPSTVSRMANPLGSLIKATKWATVKRFDDGAWYAGCWE